MATQQRREGPAPLITESLRSRSEDQRRSGRALTLTSRAKGAMGPHVLDVRRQATREVSTDSWLTPRPRPGTHPTTPPILTRQRLLELLDSITEHRVTLVVGGPGAGKTEAVSDWVAHRRSYRVAYLTLDRSLDDPARFWHALLLSLGAVAPNPGRDSMVALGSEGPSDAFLSALSASLSDGPTTIIVLDDFDSVSDPATLNSLARWVRSLPESTHLVLVGRCTPTIGLHRLLLAGELLEVTDRDLRFDLEETTMLLQQTSPDAPDSEKARLLFEQTEGWAAGLQLAMLTWDDTTLLPNMAQVSEYFIREVLLDLSVEMMQFVLETSELERMNGPLCAAVTGRADAAHILADLKYRNLLLVPVDGMAGWFRYMRLFREFLRHKFSLDDPLGRNTVHLRAATWLESAGDRTSAIAHFVTAGAYDRALELITEIAADSLLEDTSPDEDDVRQLKLIPDEFIAGHPMRMYVQASALLAAGRYREAHDWIIRLSRAVSCADGPTPAEQMRLESLWTIYDWLAGNPAAAANHGATVTGTVWPPPSAEDDDSEADQVVHSHPDLMSLDLAMSTTVRRVAARSFICLGDLEAGRRALHSVPAELGIVAAITRTGIESLIANGEGRLRQAWTLAQETLGEAQRLGVATAAGTIDAHSTISDVLREWNDLDSAEEHLRIAMSIIGDPVSTPLATGLDLQLARLWRRRRHPDAMDLVSRIRDRHLRRPLSPVMHRRLDLIEARLCLDAGDTERAAFLIEALPVDQRPIALLARLDLRSGRPDRALRRLTNPGSSTLRGRLTRLVLMARAELQLGHHRMAQDALRNAVELGRPEQYRRLFLDEGPEIAWLLNEIPESKSDHYLRGLLDAAGSEADEPVTLGSNIVEPLTRREREVLSRLTTHLSQQEIASELYVSVNTLKTHVKGLYRKLGVSSRSEAVRAARFHHIV